ncbi:MAG: phytoene/squalene synthase family protein [Candidatus Omnitrophota bacterium]
MPPIPDEKLIKEGFDIARDLAKKYAGTFYLASIFLPTKEKCAACSVYALCRVSDEAVDSLTEAPSREKLGQIKEKIDLAYQQDSLNDNLLLCFRHTVNNYKIPREYFYEFIEGMQMDLDKSRYKDFNELYDYSYKAAAVIGLIMLKIFGYSDRNAEKYAIDLGTAFQLTNILRDIKEDFQRGRIYLPQDEMARFGTSESDIAGENLSQNFKDLLKFQINRARSYFRSSEDGIRMINGKSNRLVVFLMKELYAGILDSIEGNDYDIFSKRASVNNFKTVAIILKIISKGKYL